MRALWFENGQVEVKSVPDPVAKKNESIVQVSLAGICNTDLELLNGYAGFVGIPGHEFVGEVIEGPQELLNQRVVADINLACNQCSECQQANPHHCLQRAVLGIRSRPGAFAEYVSVPTRNLYPVSRDIDDHQAVFAEPLAAADAAVLQVADASDPILVVGAGKLGLLVAHCLLADGKQVVVVQRNSLTVISHRNFQNLSSSEVPEHAFAAAVECTGNPEGVAIALRALRPKGRLVLKSTYTDSLQLNIAEVVVNELRLIGSRCGSISRALDRLASGQIDSNAMIAARYPLERAAEAFAHSARPGVLKVLLTPRQ